MKESAHNVWHPVASTKAPERRVLVVWGGTGGYRFSTLDTSGQWRSMMGAPRNPPKFWMLLDPPRGTDSVRLPSKTARGNESRVTG